MQHATRTEWAYSINTSARASSVGGTVSPSALAVLRFIRNSNLVGCTTGKSAGFSPENAAGVDTGLSPSIRKARRIAHKTADFHGLAPGVNRRHGMAGRQGDDLIGICKKRNSAAHHERFSSLLNKVREGCLELAWATCIHEHAANSTSTRGSLQLTRFALGKTGVGRVAEVSDRLGCWHQFEQQVKALSSHFGPHEVDAGDISARFAETADEANPDRIGSLQKNDRDRLGRGFGRKRTLCAFQGNDHGYLTANQFCGQRRQLIVFTMCPPVFDRYVSFLDVTSFTQASTEICEILTRQFERCKVKTRLPVSSAAARVPQAATSQ